ncbi:hypothetical protein FHS55_002637 [Angulomicrobium tetraedrale]|uniref:Major capsid protein n=1 Tax=Ancylobacter tetraedralis TaxID=217068 RepID=A0A839ZBF7_9HYPH|nr:phage major capsid protein [Ancylobacter tetraedralis]MBB3772028.1 hypothetical protein [Ancylobacter tetraedralis]
MALTTDRQYRQVLSTALALRQPGIEDLVSNSNPLWATLKRKGLLKPYTGPEIRQSLRVDKQKAQWFKGYDFLRNPPIELFNDAVWTPKQVAVPISLTGEEMRANTGKTQVHNLITGYLDGAEVSLADGLDEGIHSDGTADDGKQITGLAASVPTNPATAGLYAGISRTDNAQWRTGAYDVQTAFSDIGTQVSSVTIRPMLNRIMGQRSRNTRGADLLIMSQEHYEAYDSATVAIQRIAREGSLAGMGFSSLEYVGSGRRAEIVLASGFNNNMASNTTYGLETNSIEIRYHEDANFTPMFEGDGQRPINQDAVAQFILWQGEMILKNPLFTWRMFDSNPAA